MSQIITTQMIRDEIEDRSPEDNRLDADLSFSDQEIQVAMVAAARRYNQVPPFIGHGWSADRLPAHLSMFFPGIKAFLYQARKARLMRNDVDYSAGEVSASIDKARIAYFEKMENSHMADFLAQVADYKGSINLNHCMGSIVG